MALYRFHELVISSANALPELVEIDAATTPDCRVRFAVSAATDLVALNNDADDELDPTTITGDDGTVVSFRSGVDLFIAASADEVVVRHVVDADAATLRHMLLDHALPRLLAARGHFVSHASAVDYHGRALVFLGDSGYGKSSLAASLHRIGHTLLGDDCFVLTNLDGDTVSGMSTYNGLRLLPQSINEFYAELPATGFSSMGAGYAKVRVGDQGVNEPRPLPVAAIFVIAEPGHEGAPIAAPLSGRDAMVTLTKNSFRLDPAHGPSLGPVLDRAAAIGGCVPVFDLRYERDFGALDALHQVIFDAIADPA